MKKEAIFAAGCFWGIQDAFDKLPGVLKTEVGYTGGHTENPSYEDVCSHTTGHAEAVRVEYDDEKTSFGKLLDAFWKMHDPTQVNRQGPDVGDNYRSAVFYEDEGQKEEAEASKKALDASGEHSEPVATEITKAGAWWPAEDYHQHYYEKNPGRKIC